MVHTAARIGFLLLAAAVFPHGRAAAQHTESRDHSNASKCDLPAVLAQAGVRANELVTNIQNFTAQERIEGLALSGDDRAAATGFAIACFIMLR